MKLRDYQQEACNAIFAAWETNNSTIAVMSTGCGKTVVASHIIDKVRKEGRVMFLAHRGELIWQAAEKIKRVCGIDAGVEMGEHRAATWFHKKHQIIVSTVQTQYSGCSGDGRMSRFNPYDFSLLVVDECFPAGTLVDGKPIESIRVGDAVHAYDHTTNKQVVRRVTATMRNKTDVICRVVFADGSHLICTPNHPIYTRELGYVPADSLNDENHVLCWGNTIKKVKSIRRYRNGDGDGFELMCPGGVVYNLEVDEYHNYFAEGVLVHNCHHYVSPSYRRVVDYYRQNPRLKVLGITATPDRADQKALGNVFNSVAYNYSIERGIDEGWLVPIDQQYANVAHLNLSAVGTSAGDLNGTDLAEAMEYEFVLHEVAVAVLALTENRKTVIFCASVKHADRLSEILNRSKPASSQWVCGETPTEQRSQMFADYKAGRFQYLANVGVLTEGWDDEGVQCVVIARPTKSRALYTQMIGRGTRPLAGLVDKYDDPDDRKMTIAETHKPALLVIDLVGNSGRHKLVSTADILGGNYDDDVIERAKTKAKESEEPTTTAELLEEAARELEAEKEKKRRLDARKRSQIKASGVVTTMSVDAFDVFQLSPHRTTTWDHGKSLSESQMALLARQGIESRGLGYAEGKQLLNELFRRWDKGECSFKQAKILAKHRLPTNAKREQAKAWIDAIAANGWQCPDSLDEFRLSGVYLRSASEPVEVF